MIKEPYINFEEYNIQGHIENYTYINLIEGGGRDLEEEFRGDLKYYYEEDRKLIYDNNYKMGGKKLFFENEPIDTSGILEENINSVFSVIDDLLLENKINDNILIHCSVGNNRSPATLAFYLYTISNLSYDIIYKIIFMYSTNAVDLEDTIFQSIGIRTDDDYLIKPAELSLKFGVECLYLSKFQNMFKRYNEKTSMI